MATDVIIVAPDDGLELKPSVVVHLQTSLDTPRDELLTREQMDKQLEHHDFDTLTQAVGPAGDLCRKPCGHCNGTGLRFATDDLGDDLGSNRFCAHCVGTGEVWDELDSIVLALWEEHPLNCEDESCYADGKWEDGARRHHLHNEWCPRSEAALRLLDATLRLLADDGYIVIGGRDYPGTALVGFPGKPQQEGRIWMPGNWLDALAAAIEAKLREERKP